MTPLESLWAVETNNTLNAETKASLVHAITVEAFDGLGLPLEIAGTPIVVTRVESTDECIVCWGTGPMSWPLRMYSPPVGVPDPDGSEIAPDGSVWRTDPYEVIANVVRGVL
jgi:hypothetical protein